METRRTAGCASRDAPSYAEVFHSICLRVNGQRPWFIRYVSSAPPGDSSAAAEFARRQLSSCLRTSLLKPLLTSILRINRRRQSFDPPGGWWEQPNGRRIVEAFSARGVRTLDASGVGVPKQKLFLTALREERARSYSESQVDIIVGIQRVLEGTDWKHCSAVYCLGMPAGLAMVGQLLGRALDRRPRNVP